MGFDKFSATNEIDKITKLDDAEEYLLTKYNIKVRLATLGSIKGFIYQSKKLNIYIVINRSLSNEKKLETLKHEFKHIEFCHLSNYSEVKELCEEEIYENNY